MVIRLSFLALLLGLAGCYEPIEEVHRFSDGALLSGSARSTDVCCDVTAADGGRSTCSAYFADNGYDPDISLTAQCVAPGACVLPCPDGACECIVDLDCRDPARTHCTVLNSEARCEEAGLNADDGRCTACAACGQDADCDGGSCVDGTCT